MSLQTTEAQAQRPFPPGLNRGVKKLVQTQLVRPPPPPPTFDEPSPLCDAVKAYLEQL